ncbi:MAG: tRNA (5-methylaminomethyl-2-thiouridine)(34)-methyltransferase MnmD [Bacteroidales bacterium]
MKPEIVTTLDGSHTLYLSEIDEHYHSTNGAVDESLHVFIRSGFDYCQNPEPVVFEVGFGTGLNALMTALRSAEKRIKTTYITIEKFPLDHSVVSALNYPALAGSGADILFSLIHNCRWNEVVPINEWFEIMKVEGDLQTFEPTIQADIIYFDAFAPSKQPEMWRPEVFQKMALLLGRGGIFVTYSAKGEVRRILQSNGFRVELLPGAKGKREMIRAVRL